MTKKYLLVSEGPTDHKVIIKIGASLKTASGEDVEIQPLAPEIDRTSGKYPGYGWGGVKSWCEQHKANRQFPPNMPEQLRQAALRKSWRLLLMASHASGVIIQIDSDIAQDIAGQGVVATIANRHSICETALLAWIGENSQMPELYLAIATHSLETWILSTHQRSDPVFSDLPAGFNFEHIPDVENRLLRLGYKSERKNGRRRLRKSPNRYESYADIISANLGVVRTECLAVNSLCTHLES